MSNLVAPEKGLTIALLQSAEGPAGPEGLAYIADGTFDPTLLISRAHLAGPGQKVVVTTEFEKSRIKEDGVAAAFQHDTFEIIVKGNAGSSRPGLKSMDVPAQEVFHGLIEEKFQVESARVRKGDQKAGETPACTANPNFAEMGPVGLRLFSGKQAQSQKRFPSHRAQAGHYAPQLYDASGIAAIADHLKNACGSQLRIVL